MAETYAEGLFVPEIAFGVVDEDDCASSAGARVADGGPVGVSDEAAGRDLGPGSGCHGPCGGGLLGGTFAGAAVPSSSSGWGQKVRPGAERCRRYPAGSEGGTEGRERCTGFEEVRALDPEGAVEGDHGLRNLAVQFDVGKGGKERSELS